MSRTSVVPFLEADHEEAERTQRFIRNSIIQAHPEAPDAVMACQLEQPRRLRLLDEDVFECDVPAHDSKRHTGARAVFWSNVVGVESGGAVEDAVELHCHSSGRLTLLTLHDTPIWH